MGTAISNSEQSTFTVFPNPVTNILFINNKSNGDHEYRIINSIGNVVLTTSKKEIDVSFLVPGIYHVVSDYLFYSSFIKID